MAKTKKPAGPTPAKKRGRSRGEQLHIEGLAPEKNGKIHPVATSYVNVRDHRMEMQAEEAELKARLLELMKQEGMDHYEWDDINVMVSHVDDVKVKKGGKDTGK